MQNIQVYLKPGEQSKVERAGLSRARLNCYGISEKYTLENDAGSLWSAVAPNYPGAVRTQ